jgi:hypothetical protein
MSIQRFLGGLAPLVALSLLGAIGTAWADVSITVVNPSFEILPASGLDLTCCNTYGPYNDGSIPGWTLSNSGQGEWMPNTVLTAPDGVNVAYSNGGTISQTVAPTIVAGDVYTMTVEIGARLDTPFDGTASLFAGATPYAAVGLAPVPGTWSTYTASFVGTALNQGESITIQLNSSGVQGDYDNVNLSYTPEPGFYGALLIGLGGLVFTARLRGRERRVENK